MGWKFDFAVVAMGDRDPGPDQVPHKSHYRSRSVRMAIEVSRMKKADTLAGRCPPESGRVSLESARRGESNGIGLEVSACL